MRLFKMIHPSFLATLVFGISSLAAATPWSELEPGQVVRLKTALSLEGSLTLPKGSTFALNRISTIDMILVESLEMHLFPCTEALATKRVPMTMMDADTGFEMAPGCNTTFYLELKDYYRESPFDRADP